MRFGRTIFGVSVLLALMACPVSAQVSGGIYGGFTSDRQSTFMVMADVGGKLTVEPWIQSFNRDIQTGIDVILIPKWVGVVAGANSGPKGGHLGVAVNIFGAQIRVMKHSSGAWQDVIWYNFNINPKWYVQAWLAPATDTSSYLVGLGYNFKR